MSFTTLRVVDAGITLYAWHESRFAGDPEALAAFHAFASVAQPGIWALRFTEGSLVVERRAGSRLVDGQPVRFAVSPFAERSGSFAKPSPPNRYDEVRAPGVATLLTSSDGREIFESCVASVVAWDGTGLVTVPEDRPRVASCAERFLRRSFPVRSAPLLAEEPLPLLLVNAVRTAAPFVPGRPEFPLHMRQALESSIDSTARRA